MINTGRAILTRREFFPAKVNLLLAIVPRVPRRALALVLHNAVFARCTVFALVAGAVVDVFLATEAAESGRAVASGGYNFVI